MKINDYFQGQDLFSQCSEPEETDDISDKTTILSCQPENLNENDNHTEEVIIGFEQGMTFPTKIGTTMCNALIDTVATRKLYEQEILQEIAIGQNSFSTKY